MNREKSNIVFVDNVDNSVFNLLSDLAHKTFSPQTYPWNPCAITHASVQIDDHHNHPNV